jgi:uncharacterized protein (DUF1778 family)
MMVKAENIQFRVSLKESEAIRKVAEHLGRTISGYVRLAVLADVAGTDLRREMPVGYLEVRRKKSAGVKA